MKYKVIQVAEIYNKFIQSKFHFETDKNSNTYQHFDKKQLLNPE